uniref:Uncharacterized protein n=1 Tax=Candidatus Kentrum sp. SD TaxID=2126332 RepID=A0A451BLP3_9GAMM|nr:MAG: hypothetical protein BECKSD772D_GA0070982_10408 [Candidatus Kentron sp. SD]
MMKGMALPTPKPRYSKIQFTSKDAARLRDRATQSGVPEIKRVAGKNLGFEKRLSLYDYKGIFLRCFIQDFTDNEPRFFRYMNTQYCYQHICL